MNVNILKCEPYLLQFSDGFCLILQHFGFNLQSICLSLQEISSHNTLTFHSLMSNAKRVLITVNTSTG